MKRIVSTVLGPFRFAVRRPITTLFLLVALIGGTVVGLTKKGVDVLPPPYSERLRTHTDDLIARSRKAKTYLVAQYEKYFATHEEAVHHEEHKIVVTSPQARDVTITEGYVCQIHSQRHINVCALDGGYLEEIFVKEGQAVKKGDLMFKIVPVLYQAKLEAEKAEADLAQLEYNNTKMLSDSKVVSQNEVLLLQAKLAKAQAKASLARAELNFTNVRAPFDGIIDRLHEQLGSLIKEGDILTTLSDNSVMWVYFNVPEAQYLDYMAALNQHREDPKLELMLAGDRKFPQVGKIGAIEAKFNNETGNIAFRADFPNPDRLLRHGQTGTVLLSRVSKDVTVIPQRATFEILAKRYVYVVGEDGKAHQREISIQNEMDDIFVVNKGVKAGEKIVLEGIRQVHDGEEVHYEFNPPELVMANLKNRAE
ncbi:efflux RND transporter periplasmic adaptor subunit [Paludisphaera mucosa]|uniref:Efflux RND transporter periplasmic adaptor subunit n=1 Tax=Paludisphaera mucosa TaxID=3030827 RepID=A0ABT6FDT0_9BACT|nr:efflux RND transporter periplasmic adaptor subunit [Paludisphaera mucosa]MDG3005735.1 efflux RND transporter periplasmic adaptor subunit [Paludisphaera mucosa]